MREALALMTKVSFRPWVFLLLSGPTQNKSQTHQDLRIPNHWDPRHVLPLAAYFHSVAPIPEPTLAAKSMTQPMSAPSLTGFRSGNAVAVARVVFIGSRENSCRLAMWHGAPGNRITSPVPQAPASAEVKTASLLADMTNIPRTEVAAEGRMLRVAICLLQLQCGYFYPDTQLLWKAVLDSSGASRKTFSVLWSHTLGLCAPLGPTTLGSSRV